MACDANENHGPPGHTDIAALHARLLDLEQRKAPLDKATFRRCQSLLHSDRLQCDPAALKRHGKLIDHIGDAFRSMRKRFKVDSKGLTAEQKAKREATRAKNKTDAEFWAAVHRGEREHPVPMPDRLDPNARKRKR